MSAIPTTCPKCGGFYMSGMVNTTPWPAHVCSIEALLDEEDYAVMALEDNEG